MDILLLIVDYSPSLVREYMMQVIHLFLYWSQCVHCYRNLGIELQLAETVSKKVKEDAVQSCILVSLFA